MYDLREYQETAFETLRKFARKTKRILLSAPCGSGKTVIASHLIKSAVEKGRQVLFLAHRRELIDQTCEKLDNLGIEHGVIMSKDKRRSLIAPVQVASIQTLINRDLPAAHLLILDEAHHARSKSWEKLLDSYPTSYVVGLTATPCRHDGRGLGNIFDELVDVSTTRELTELGYLVRAKVYAPDEPDLEGVKVVRGDYEEKELEKRTVKLIGNIVEHWERHARGRPTAIFAITRSHSEHLVNAFINAGHKAVHLDCDTPRIKRQQTLKDLHAGKIQQISSVGLFTEGWDEPLLSCAIMARPTKSFSLHRQMAGRLLRTAEGKEDAIILDHSGNVLVHGLPDDEVEWTLDKTQKVAYKPVNGTIKKAAARWVCGQCFYINDPGKPYCLSCGLRATPRAVGVKVGDGILREYNTRKKQKPSQIEKQKYLDDLIKVARQKQYKRGWISHRYKAHFGVWPRGLNFDYGKVY